LLWALVAESEGPLIVAHLNHRLRGDDSDADEEFVRLLALSLWLPFRSERIDVRAAAAGDNLESAARRLRYDWLARVARESGARWSAGWRRSSTRRSWTCCAGWRSRRARSRRMSWARRHSC